MTTESCRPWRGELAAAAAGRLDDDERTRLLAHLDGCAACRAELAELERAARLLAARVDIDHVTHDQHGGAPAGLGDAIVARLRDEHATAAANRTRRRRRVAARASFAVAAAAAAVLLAVALAGGGPSRAHVTVALRTRGAHADARLVRDQGGTEIHFDGAGLHDTDIYWLWLTDAHGRRVGAGTFNGGRTGRFDVTTYCAVPYARVRRVWVTDDANRVVLDAWVTPKV